MSRVTHTAGCVLLASTAALVLGTGTARAAPPHATAPSAHHVDLALGQPDVPGAEQNLGYAYTDLLIILGALGL